MNANVMYCFLSANNERQMLKGLTAMKHSFSTLNFMTVFHWIYNNLSQSGCSIELSDAIKVHTIWKYTACMHTSIFEDTVGLTKSLVEGIFCEWMVLYKTAQYSGPVAAHVKSSDCFSFFQRPFTGVASPLKGMCGFRAPAALLACLRPFALSSSQTVKTCTSGQKACPVGERRWIIKIGKIVSQGRLQGCDWTVCRS